MPKLATYFDFNWNLFGVKIYKDGITSKLFSFEHLQLDLIRCNESSSNISEALLSVHDSTDAGQNSRFSKRDKTADFQNGTKQPIFKTGQNSRFSKRNKMSVVTANMHGT